MIQQQLKFEYVAIIPDRQHDVISSFSLEAQNKEKNFGLKSANGYVI